ncbi:hypothetical protein VPH35_122791 [Triticum aestivum]
MALRPPPSSCCCSSSSQLPPTTSRASAVGSPRIHGAPMQAAPNPSRLHQGSKGLLFTGAGFISKKMAASSSGVRAANSPNLRPSFNYFPISLCVEAGTPLSGNESILTLCLWMQNSRSANLKECAVEVYW